MRRLFANRAGPTSCRGRGQALVEFALVAPLVFFLFFVLIEAGRLGASAAMVAEAARAAAHAGSFNSVTTDAPLRKAARDAVPLLGSLPDAAFTINPRGTDSGGPARVPGGTISVTVAFDYTVLPVFSTVFGSTLRLDSTSVMGVE